MSENRIEIPIKKRHKEVQNYWMTLGDNQIRGIGQMLAVIADRLADIEDAIRERTNVDK